MNKIPNSRHTAMVTLGMTSCGVIVLFIIVTILNIYVNVYFTTSQDTNVLLESMYYFNIYIYAIIYASKKSLCV